MTKVGEGGPMAIAAVALRAQQARMRIIAENIANSQTTAATPGGDPYRRQMPIFAPLKLEDGSTSVQLVRTDPDPKAFKKEYNPGHPAADPSGNVTLSNVETLVESLDFKAAQRAYEANLNVIDTSHAMEQSTMRLLQSK
ncbi:flagellar basal body rod protein FlgC [Phenylobacterium sp. SCN 70-31]|uniref:flagellar basal body rod protein FlgC n=1 Tax=Phenylobacterium sp. SCN 70-31 TaxID=1660129 RepID=UPI000A8A5B65|nr:flagellar basal body rod protein FlgC [Phenylobacterium sp. SCN 70-31]